MPEQQKMGDVLEALAERLTAFDTKLQSIIYNRGGALSAGGQATAIAMLVTLNLPLFAEAAAALRARSAQSGGDRG